MRVEVWYHVGLIFGGLVVCMWDEDGEGGMGWRAY